jgi:hypothetical protein
VETERIELSSAGCKPAVLPLNDVPMVAEVGIEPDLIAAYETAVCSSSASPHQNLPASKSGPSRNRTCDLPCIRRMHSLPCSRPVEPCARVELASLLYRSGASPAMLTGPRARTFGASGANRTLVGRLPCDRSPIELHRLEPKGGFEPPLERYEGSVFPTKLLRRF